MNRLSASGLNNVDVGNNPGYGSSSPRLRSCQEGPGEPNTGRPGNIWSLSEVKMMAARSNDDDDAGKKNSFPRKGHG